MLLKTLDPRDLSQSGWGVIFADDDRNRIDALKEALKPLLDLRREQSGDLYKEYLGRDAYRPGESKSKFLARQGEGPGPADPDRVPYYLLLVGDPESIPMAFQKQMSVQRAVGRIAFGTLEEYASYAKKIVLSTRVTHKKNAAVFAPTNGVEVSSNREAIFFGEGLVDYMLGEHPDWQVEAIVGSKGRKERLSALVHGPTTPSLLVVSAHGLGFSKTDPRQVMDQGALVCADWHGPGNRSESLPPEFYFGADDVSEGALRDGVVALFFTSYSAVTPQHDGFLSRVLGEQIQIGPRAFVSRLANSLLASPNGGFLALVGMAERVWSYGLESSEKLIVHEAILNRILNGDPVGLAIEYANERYAELSTDLTDELEEIVFGAEVDEVKLVNTWAELNDFKNMFLLGDPAVHLNLESPE